MTGQRIYKDSKPNQRYSIQVTFDFNYIIFKLKKATKLLTEQTSSYVIGKLDLQVKSACTLIYQHILM